MNGPQSRPASGRLLGTATLPVHGGSRETARDGAERMVPPWLPPSRRRGTRAEAQPMGNETKAIGAGPTDGSTQRWPHLGRRLTAPRQRRTWSSRLGGSVRKVLVVGLAVPMLLAVGVGPVLADTTGGNGTQFNSFTSSCAQSGTRQVCTDTQIGTFTDDTGEAQLCVDVFTYSISGRGSFTFIADQFGCTSEFSQTIGSDYSVTIEPTTVSLATCKAHQRQCSGSTEVTVSASDTTVNDV